jgi:glycosyltransferase involved in cell wall biosynthesis
VTVGICLLTLVPGQVGGSETYARELVRALARDEALDYRVFLPTLAPDAAGSASHAVVRSYRASRSTAGRLAAMVAAALRPGALRRELSWDRLDAVHYPLTVPLPRPDGKPAAATIHDLQHLYLPELFTLAERAYRRVVYGWAANAERVVVPSSFVAGTVAERLGVPAERLRVVHHGVDHDRFSPAPGKRAPFLLYPANRWPHKNHARLLEAFAALRRDRPELRLVLTGSGHDERTAPPGVEVRGRVSAAELVELYRTAACLVFPSLYEGFGYPPLEAMACGCPVACSAAGSLPEVVGDAAVLFDPREPGAIAEAVERALADPDLPARGLERAAAFTWEACARGHEAVYRELV